jgi:hypothetical protein
VRRAAGFPRKDYRGALERILELQRGDGAIPWFDEGVVDPWNHTEAAMGLIVAGHFEAAARAFAFLADTQLTDGSWRGGFGAMVPIQDGRFVKGAPVKLVRDTNFCAYPATGLWHHFLVTGDAEFLGRHFPMIERAIDWVLSWQSTHGELRWAADDPETPEEDSLLAGSCSVYKSLECAIYLARRAGQERPDWEVARSRLGAAIRDKPWRFDRMWAPKSHFAMDWYYPVLVGALEGEAARARIRSRYAEFVIAGVGCRCVSGVPWVTVAESAELAIALARIGLSHEAQEIFAWQHKWRDEAGAYWMGHQSAENMPWPSERPAWTAGAMLLAADTLHGFTPAARLFHDCLPELEAADLVDER